MLLIAAEVLDSESKDDADTADLMINYYTFR
jgi:hypothetical protein